MVIRRKISESSHVSNFCKGSAIRLYKLSIHFQLFSSLEIVIVASFVIYKIYIFRIFKIRSEHEGFN